MKDESINIGSLGAESEKLNNSKLSLNSTSLSGGFCELKHFSGPDMEDGEEEPPLAVEICDADQPQDGGVSVGVTVITGYLGAGKSTLVNYILNAQHGKRIAVILNEFGEEIGVERAMINEGEGGALVEEWVELANGCVCCTVKHSLVQALEQLVQMKRRLDHILLETTGLANPAPLASVLWLDEQLESAVKLDSIITVVDAKNLRLQLQGRRDSSSFPEAFLQIAFADVVILNKVDMVSAEGSDTLEDLEKEIYKINSIADIIRSVRCQVDLSRILDRWAYDSGYVTHLESLLQESQSLSASKTHDSSVRTLCIMETRKVDLDKVIMRPFIFQVKCSFVISFGFIKSSMSFLIFSQVRLWLEDILWDKKYGMEVYRCKGVLSVSNSDLLHTLQAVKEIYEVVPAREWKEGEDQINKIVFIGHNLNEEVLIDSLRSCALSTS
ncbi:COBW domain-containing protein 1 isoform X1 [Punica granatum]|uniref:COBW domain-containing protein 1 isoform X1 n=1 Tax=Punica granatum TaxID=22663 RepID=A0A6P8CQD0_PUNGR|nr:COBW domain-containing protein 1 isoform X1 [Punica granatum]